MRAAFVASLVASLLLAGCTTNQQPTTIENYSGPTPEGASARIGRGAFDDAALSPDGSLLALGSHLGVYLYHADTMQQLWYYSTTSKTRSIAFSPDGSTIAAGELGSPVIHILDADSGTLIADLDEGHTLGICDLEFSSDGTLLASTSYDNQAILWDTETWETRYIIDGDGSGGNGIAFSPDDSKMAYVVDSGTVFVVDVESGERLREFSAQNRIAYGAEWSPDGEIIVTGADRKALLWDAEEGTLLREIGGFEDRVERLDFSPDGRYLLIGSQGDSAKLFDMNSREVIEEWDGHVVAFSGDGKWFVVGAFSDAITIFKTRTRQPEVIYKGHTDDILSIDWLPDGTLIGGTHIVGLQQWDVENGLPLNRIDGPLWLYDTYASPDGSYAATASAETLLGLDLETGDVLWEAEPDQHFLDISMSPDGLLVASIEASHVDIYDAQTGDNIVSLVPGGLSTHFLTNNLLATAGQGEIIVWDVSRGERVYELQPYDELVLEIAVSGDQQVAASLGLDNRIVIWSVEAGDVLTEIEPPIENLVKISLSADGSLVAVGTAYGEVRLWDTDSGEQIADWKGHVTGVTDLLFSPDDSTLISSAVDGTLVLWDVP